MGPPPGLEEPTGMGGLEGQAPRGPGTAKEDDRKTKASEATPCKPLSRKHLLVWLPIYSVMSPSPNRTMSPIAPRPGAQLSAIAGRALIEASHRFRAASAPPDGLPGLRPSYL